MPQIRVNNVELFYEEQGSGSEVMLFSHGYLMDHTMYAGQIEAFKDRFRCVAYDHRGHGRSEQVTSSYDLDALVNDAIALIEALEIGPVHFVGMSTGGFVGLRLALRRPDLLRSLVLIDTSADAEDKGKLKQYNLLLKTVNMVGWRPVIGRVMPILFYEVFLDDDQRKDEVKKWRGIITGHNTKAVTAFANAIFSRDSVVDQLGNIQTPTVVIVGKHDSATPASYSQTMADRIHDCRLRVIPDSGHSSPVEKPRAVAEAMRVFFERVGIL
ncbi:MAG: alpha/beta fold hydrolase [Anaerolineales bacterium]|nr:alpha/beta fold hydrolase [Anaerolineales bacterium]